MADEGQLLSQEMREHAIGLEGAPATIDVEKGAVRRFAEAIGDPNPLWNDEPGAGKSRYGGMIAPPTFLRSVKIERPELSLAFPLSNRLDAGSDWEYFEPVRVGDRITGVARIVDTWERSGKLGPMVFTLTEIKYTNQSDQVVATQRAVSILYSEKGA